MLRKVGSFEDVFECDTDYIDIEKQFTTGERRSEIRVIEIYLKFLANVWPLV